MSLVAYAASSDEDNSDSDHENEPIAQDKLQVQLDPNEISDEEESFATSNDKSTTTTEAALQILNLNKPSKFHLQLPAPSKQDNLIDNTETITFSLAKLPAPKTNDVTTTQSNLIIEEDDEFLHKKSMPSLVEKPPPPPPALVTTVKGPVKITIPSLAQFRHLEETTDIGKKLLAQPNPAKASGLLNLLPKPKNEQFFASKVTSNVTETQSTTASSSSSITSLIPDSVKNRQLKKKVEAQTQSKQNEKSLVDCTSDDSNDDDDDSNEDFFSLNTDEQLPEVSITEINAMVAKRAAKMAKAKNDADKNLNSEIEKTADQQYPQRQSSSNGSNQETVRFDENAIQALVGRQAKRRKLAENVQVVELSSAQVLPNKDEWLRSALASETTYQANGVLVDEEPAPGTRKKHQITYLAHQAKANEAELQAMWAANRQTRRATASKYGF